MGQKVNPISFRVSAGKDWKSHWFSSKKQYSVFLLEDLKIRNFLFDKLKLAGITEVEVDRLISKMKITIYVSRPGMVIGRGGSGLEDLKKMLLPMVSVVNPDKNMQIEVIEVKNPDSSAQILASRIASDLEKRLPYRRIIKKSVERVLASGAKGVRIIIAGRIDGAEIARRQRVSKGKVPLGTMRADIDYASVPALTKSGYIGVKVWIYREEKGDKHATA